MTEEVELARVLHLLASCQDAAMLIDCKTRRCVEVNRQAVELLGCERGGLLAAGSFQDHQDNANERRDILATCGGLIERFPQAIASDAVFHHRDGGEIRVTLTRQALRAAGRWQVLLTARPASPRAEAHEQPERLFAAMNEAADALQVVDASAMTYEVVNDAAAGLCGMSRERMMAIGPIGVGQEIEKLAPDAVRAQHEEAIARYPEAVRGVRELQAGGGSARMIEFTRRAMRRDDRWFIVIAQRDVTERLADQRRLKQMQAALDDSDAFGVIDVETLTYVEVNQAAARMFGVSREDIFALGPIGLRAMAVDASPGDDIEAQLRQRYAQAIARAPAAATTQTALRRGDGSVITMEATRRAFRSGEGWLIVVVMRDITERVADQRRLKQLEAAIDQAADQILVIDPETMGYLHINKMTEQQLGMTREEMMRAGVGPVVQARAGTSAQHSREVYRDLIASYPAAMTVLRQLTRPDGTAIDVETTRRAVQVDGKWLIVSVGRDITERKAVEHRLEQLRVAVNEAADGIQVIDPRAMTFEDVNEAAARIFGMSRARMLELGPVAVGETMGLAPAESLAARFEEVIARHPEAVGGTREFSLNGGAVRTLEFSRRAVRVDDRWLIVSVERDVTQRVTEQRHLQRLLAAVNEAPDSLTIADPELMRNVDVNEAATQLYGLTREELLSRPLYEVPYGFGVNSAQDLARTYRKIIDQEPEPLRRIREFRGKDRPVAMVESTRRAVKVDGKWLIVGVMRDVTDRVRAERELQQRMEELARSNRDLEQFAYVTSHDLSEPLRMVASYTQLLARRYGAHFDDDGREFMGYIVNGAQRMKQLIDDLLVYSRAGRADTQFKSVCLDRPLDEAIANLKHAIRDSNARIERPAAMPTLPADKTGMTQLFQNLLANAIKFRGEAPLSIRIEAAQEDAGWIFSVIDNGIGIEQQYFERVFVIFQRLHARSSYEGTGIGLAICKKIVERHGGSIWVEPAEGGGASFKVRLPATPGQAAAGSAAACRRLLLLQRHHLLVDRAEDALAVASLHLDADRVAELHVRGRWLAVEDGLDRALLGDAAVALGPFLLAVDFHGAIAHRAGADDAARAHVARLADVRDQLAEMERHFLAGVAHADGAAVPGALQREVQAPCVPCFAEFVEGDRDGAKRRGGLALEEAEALGQLVGDEVAQRHVVGDHDEADAVQRLVGRGGHRHVAGDHRDLGFEVEAVVLARHGDVVGGPEEIVAAALVHERLRVVVGRHFGIAREAH
jgi:PAS domain S-box-containing protein